jgi:hypothetical protein
VGVCIKLYEDGVVTKNKARLVAKGYTQVEGLDFGETFATHHNFKLHIFEQ